MAEELVQSDILGREKVRFQLFPSSEPRLYVSPILRLSKLRGFSYTINS